MTEFGSLNCSPDKWVLNNVKTICLRFWKVVVHRVALIKLRVNNRCGNGTGSFEVKIGADTTKFTNVIITRLERDDIWSEKVRWLSKMKPRFRAESVVLSEQLWFLANCCRRPMSRNSVLEEINVDRLAVIQEDMCCRGFWWVTDESKSGGRKDRKSCVLSAYRWWFKERDEIRVLRGDVYTIKSRGPRTEPWGTPHKQAHEEEK